ncbi:MAG: HAMP domain-containing protein [Candidatus Saganbacteria bacterium]|nr:HAMP domain-containing protein [Candidatus Saganbacteria bacterium]
MSLTVSILNTVGVFVQVFISILLLAILYYFIPAFLRTRKKGFLFLSFVFLFFLVYVIATLLSRWPELEPLVLAKIITLSLLLGGFFLFLFINSRSKIKGDLGVVIVLSLVFAGLVVAAVILPDLKLTFLNLELARLVWFGLWGFWGLASLVNFFTTSKEDRGQRTLYFYTSFSAFLLFLSYLLGKFYPADFVLVGSLISNIFILFGSVGVALGEGVDPKSSLALNPLNYFRSRLLFKIIFSFVLFFIIFFGATHIFIIHLTTQNFRQDLLSRYEDTIEDVSRVIERQEKVSQPKLYGLVTSFNVGPNSAIYIVDSTGRLLVKPPSLKMKSGENLAGLYPVKEILKGRSGGGEFIDINGVPMLGVYRPIKSMNIGIILQQPVSDVYKGMLRLENDLLLYVIGGMVLTIVIGFLFASTLERPLRMLARGTQAITAGDHTYRIDTKSIDEIGTLAQAYNQMNSELKETQNRLVISEKMIALGNMAAGMAHEIRNPLVSLMTFTQLLGQRWDDAEFRSKFSTIVPREIERINRIAESLLRFGRPWRAEVKDVRIEKVLEEVLLLFEPEMKKTNIVLNTKFSDVPAFKGDAPQLVQAFTNIVKNAIEAMGERGGGDLFIETEYIMALKLKGRHFLPNEMTWGHKIEEKPYIMVKVSDSGGGVDLGKLRNLFDPFFTSKTYGTGMGLPITLRIIEEHRGTIKVKSKQSEGTTFVVYLPQEGKIISSDPIL